VAVGVEKAAAKVHFFFVLVPYSFDFCSSKIGYAALS